MVRSPLKENDDYDCEKGSGLTKSFRHYSNGQERSRVSPLYLNVQQNILENSIFDSSPTALHKGTTFENIMKLRPRQPDKEIGAPSFRIKQQSRMEGVYDEI